MRTYNALEASNLIPMRYHTVRDLVRLGIMKGDWDIRERRRYWITEDEVNRWKKIVKEADEREGQKLAEHLDSVIKESSQESK